MQHTTYRHSLFTCLLILIGLSGCNDFLGTKTKLDFIVPPENTGRDVSYVPVLPYFTGLQGPTAVITGNDKLIYVVDSAAQQLICFDEAGREQSRMTVPGIRRVLEYPVLMSNPNHLRYSRILPESTQR